MAGIGTVAALLFLYYFFSFKDWIEVPNPSSASVVTAGSVSLSQEKARLPSRVIITHIGVDAPVEDVELTSLGAMDVPQGPQSVGWFSRGPRPGEKGTAVITGHYGWKGGKTAAFDHLSTLRPGDTIEVVDVMGSNTVFAVRDMHVYPADTKAPEVFTSKEGTHLNLITCSGAWDASVHSYRERLVVFADLKV